MVYTSHGKHIPGSIQSATGPGDTVQCDGVEKCTKCKSQAEVWNGAPNLFVVIGNQIVDLVPDRPKFPPAGASDYLGKARTIVRDYIVSDAYWGSVGTNSYDLPTFDVHVVWASKVLQNWKVVLTTTLPSSPYFEVTYNGDKKTAYMDVYNKHVNFEVRD